MRVEGLKLAGVSTHTATDLELPARGLVLIEGVNGSGKTSLVHALPLALWGKTPGGRHLWARDDGEVAAKVDGRIYRRFASGRCKLRLEWEGAPTPDTTTDGQRLIDAELGTFDDWIRTSLISAADGRGFADAADTERKQVLERACGLDELDPAYDLARARARKAAAEATAAGTRVSTAKATADARQGEWERAHADAKAAMDAVAAAAPTSSVEALRAELAIVEAALTAAQADHRTAAADAASAKALAAKASASARQALGPVCPTCGQKVAGSTAEEVKAEAAKLEKLAAGQREIEIAAMGEVRAATREVEEVRETLREAEAAAAAAAALEEARERAQKRLADADKARVAAWMDHGVAQADHGAAIVAAEKAQTWADALSPKGARARLLDGIVARLAAGANRWLGAMGARQRVEITARAEKARGGLSDAIGLKVDGRAYADASGGERRRVDVALALALAEVAEATRGRPAGTLFLDEVLDVLDEDGVDGVSAALAESAWNRCIVVIAHSAGPVVADRADYRFRVKGGHVTAW